jgi:hypothetical protein
MRIGRILVPVLLVSAIILSVCLVSCSSSGSTIIPETTKVLDEATLNSLSGASVNSSTLSFGNITEQLNSLAVGDVIVCGVSNVTPYGLLRKVTNISTDESQMIVETVNATLEDAIQECDISGTWSLLPDGSAVPLGILAGENTQTCAMSSDTNAQLDSTGGMNSAALAGSCTGWYIDIDDLVLFDLDKDLGTTNDQVVADGSLCADVQFDFGFEIKDWKLEEACFLLTTVETAELEIMLQAGFAVVSEKLELYRKWLKPFTVWVGIVPIVVAPVLTFNIGVDATASAGISTSVSLTNEVTVGLKYVGGAWSPVTDRSTSFEWESPSVTAGCEVKGYVGPQLTLLVCGVTGPYGEVRGYLELEADLFDTPWWKLYGGIEAAVGFRADILGHLIADYEVPAAIGYRVLLAQAETGTSLEWSKTFGGVDDEWPYWSVQQTADGGYILAGGTESYGAGSMDVWLIKTDSSGNKVWDKTFGGTEDDGALSIQQTSGGGYVIAGYTESYGAGAEDIWLIKTDSSGNKVWDKTFGGTGYEGAWSVQQASDGGYIVAGRITPYEVGEAAIWLIKTDSGGNKVWDRAFGGLDCEAPCSVRQTSDGGYIIVGSEDSYGTSVANVWLIKTDSSGSKVWEKTFGETEECLAYTVEQTSDGGYVLAGVRDTWEPDALLIKTDSSGNKVWDKTFGGTGGDAAAAVQQTPDGGYILAGGTESYGAGSVDVWLIKTDSSGNKVWDKTFGGAEDDWAWSVRRTSDGGYILAGGTESYGAGAMDVWLLKLG